MIDYVEVKVLLNKRYGGFRFSDDALLMLLDMGIDVDDYSVLSSLNRSDPRLIEVVEKLGPKASAEGADIQVVKVTLYIKDFDGIESIKSFHEHYW